PARARDALAGRRRAARRRGRGAAQPVGIDTFGAKWVNRSLATGSAASSSGAGRSWRSGQLLVALGFAELSSHYPVAGSVFQWTTYLAGKTYSWFAGWIYLFAV